MSVVMKAFLYCKNKGEPNDETLDSPFYSMLLYCLDSLPAFLQNRCQFFHGRGSQHGDSGLSEVGDALEDRGGG